MTDLARLEERLLDPALASRRRTFGWILALGFVLFILPGLIAKYTPYSWLIGDGGFYLNMQKSLTWFGTLEQSSVHPHSWYDGHREINDAFSNIALGKNGEWWPKHGYVMPIVALPFYWIFGPVGSLVFNVLSVTAVVALSYAIACRFAAPGPSAVAAFTIGVAGPHVDYAYNFSNDGFYTVFVLGAFLAALRPTRPQAGGVASHLVMAGVLLGVAVWTKITNVLFAPLLWVVALTMLDWRPGRRLVDAARVTRDLALGAAIPLSAFGAANWVMFGKPWVTSYQRVLIAHGGQTAIASHADLFTVPLKDGLKELFLDVDHGLLRRYALTTLGWFGLAGLILRPRARWFAIAFAATSLGFFWFFARFKYYHERFLFPYFGLLAVPAAALLDGVMGSVERLEVSPRRRVAIAVLAVSALGAGALWAELDDRRAHHLSAGVEKARVYLGDTRCDYFNNMRWSWECDGSRGEEQYIGVNANQKHVFGGAEVDGLVFAPGHESRRPIRIVFPDLTISRTLRFRYGLDEQSKEGAKVELTVWVGEIQLLRQTVTERGALVSVELPTEALFGQRSDVVVSIDTRDRERARLCFDGVIRSE